MEIKPINNLQAPKEIQEVSQQVKAQAPPKLESLKGDTADFAATNNLVQKTKETAEVRADKVARARMLIQDPTYPDNVTIDQIAKLLADHLTPKK